MRCRNSRRFAVVAAWACAGTAHAQPDAPRGVVLAINSPLRSADVGSADAPALADIYLDLGSKDGVGEGAVLQLEHQIVATDPTTGKTLRDHFALGTITVAKSGDRISVAHAAADLARRIAPGDRVLLTTAPKAYADAWQSQIDDHKPLTARTPDPTLDHNGLARDAWQETLGRPLEYRIARWQQLLTEDPQTPYRRSIETEINHLQDQQRKRDAAIAQSRSTTADRASRIEELATELVGTRDQILHISAIGSTDPGRPTDIALTVTDPKQVGRAYLYTRGPDQPGYRRSELVRDGDAYLRGQIPANATQWYAEVPAPNGGRATPAIGSPSSPRELHVAADLTDPPPMMGRSHIDIHFDFVDFDGKLAKGYDHYYQVEGDFMYRFLRPIYSVRLGFGTLTGIGGPKHVIDSDPLQSCRTAGGNYACKRVTFSYVYSEYEFKLNKILAVLLRPQIGVLSTDAMPDTESGRCQTRNSAGCQFLTGAGGRVRLRIGDEQATNLVLGASFSRGVGTLLEANYHWLPARVVPVQVSVQVTDQPVVDNFGVRLIADIGYRRLRWFYPSLRVSYQARSLQHTGVSGGMALNFDW